MNPSLYSCGIVGVGTHVPERVLSNFDLEKMVETSDAWIVSRTGIRERRFCRDDEATSDIALRAAQGALADAGLEPDLLDMIICCTMTPDHICPSTACVVQGKLGLRRPIPAFDLSAACSGFIYGCSVGAAMVRTGSCRNVLVIGAETMSKVLDFEDRNTCVLFGDGAGAVVLSRVEPGRGLLGEHLAADGGGADLIIIPSSGSREPASAESVAQRRQFLRMNGNEVYKFATRILGTAVLMALADTGNGLKPADLEVIIPHQANIRIIETAAKKLGLPMERFVVNIGRYGNTSAATVPLALAEARADGRIKDGTLLAMVAFGGGLTYAASVWRW
jgi:3-oxoacyl-[acyl-carrier-protein] synthase-3